MSLFLLISFTYQINIILILTLVDVSDSKINLDYTAASFFVTLVEYMMIEHH